MANKIEKHMEIAAPVAKVWDALTNHEKFGSCRWRCPPRSSPSTSARGKLLAS